MVKVEILKIIYYCRQFGIKRLIQHFWNRIFKRQSKNYAKWFKKHMASPKELENQRGVIFSTRPLISILIINQNSKDVDRTLASIQNQTYDNWELFSYQTQETDGYLAVIDAGVELTPDAFYQCVTHINLRVNTDWIYTDGDLVDWKTDIHVLGLFKPDFSIDYLRSNNYIGPFCLIRKSLLQKYNFNSSFDSVWLYDIYLHLYELTNNVFHIPEVLYHDNASKYDASGLKIINKSLDEKERLILSEHFKRCHIKAEIYNSGIAGIHDVVYSIAGKPLVSIIIPNCNHMEDLKRCIESFEKSIYSNYEIIIVENNSEDTSIFQYYASLNQNLIRVRVLKWKQPFNYSAINNYAVQEAFGDYLLFLNNDTELIDVSGIERMVANCQRDDVGIVGAKLFYPDKSIQHAGTIVGYGGTAAHAFSGLRVHHRGYLAREMIQQDMSAVTAACMMVKRNVFQAVGGFDENIAVAFNDVDFCLKVRQIGMKVIFIPNVTLYHYESKSRGVEDTPEKLRRYNKEVYILRERWKLFMERGDPFYNHNLTLEREMFTPK